MLLSASAMQVLDFGSRPQHLLVEDIVDTGRTLRKLIRYAVGVAHSQCITATTNQHAGGGNIDYRVHAKISLWWCEPCQSLDCMCCRNMQLCRSWGGSCGRSYSFRGGRTTTHSSLPCFTFFLRVIEMKCRM
jgi:hypothetical protein